MRQLSPFAPMTVPQCLFASVATGPSLPGRTYPRNWRKTKSALAGRSAMRRVKYGYHSVP